MLVSDFEFCLMCFEGCPFCRPFRSTSRRNVLTNREDTAYYFFAPQVDVVAMISQEDVEAFRIIHIDTSSGKVLASAS